MPCLAVGLVAFALQVESVRTMWARIGTFAGKSARDAARTVYGPELAGSFELLAGQVPARSHYLVTDGPNWGEEINWMRFALAPRRPVLVTRLEEGREIMVAPSVPRDAPVLIRSGAGEGRPPVLLDPVLHFSGLPTVRPEVEDLGLPSGLSLPEEGRQVEGDLQVEAWCLGPGGRPCAGFYFRIDGEWRLPDSFERNLGPGLESAASTGDAPPAERFRASFASLKRLESHELVVLAVTNEAKFRKLGPRSFFWRRRP